MNRFSFLLTPLVTVLFIFVALYLFSFLFGPIPLSVNSVTTTKTDLFTVSGEGEASAVPDTAEFSVGVTQQAATVEQAQQQTNEAATAIINGLKELGIPEENIQTSNYSVNPTYDFSGSTQRITGYTVTQNLTVEMTPIDRANDAVDVATSNGANMVDSMTFKLNDQKQKEVEEQARQQAIDNAKEKAQSIADTAGIRLGRIINVMESSTPPQPMFMESRTVALDSAGQAAPTQLEPGQNVITISVTLSYETL